MTADSPELAATSQSFSPAEERIGRLIGGKYRLLRLIGQGGMGAVYEAQHAVIGRRFAVKFLHARWAGGEAALARFRREAQAAGTLVSEHIAQVTDFDVTEDGAPYLVMEYLLGESLAELLQREGPLSVPRVLHFVLQACRGLAEAHAAGVVHRDLKPDNLFVVRRADGSEQIKVLDFGIAKVQTPEDNQAITRTGAMLGTPFYMAPEQARGERNVDQRVDVYALGVISYELLSGSKPHPGDSYNAILAHILTEAPQPLQTLRRGLPPGLADVIHRTMALDPNARPPSVTELGRQLGSFVDRSETATPASQFDLRAKAPSPVETTLPTLDSLSTSHTAHPTPERHPTLPPNNKRRAWVTLLTLSAAAVGAALIWRPLSTSNVASETKPALGSSALASTSSREVPDAPVTAAASAPVTAAAAPAPAHSAAPPARGRPRVQDTGRSAPATSTSAAFESVLRKPVNSANFPVVSDETAPKASARVRFDSRNPYE